MKDCITLIISLFISGSMFAQVNVIQFNSSWNEENDYNMSELKNCEIHYISICENPELIKDLNIISVPTIIILDNGQEIERFEGGIMMEIKATQKEIQEEIDKLLLAKFN
tara:strand:+ start:6583 stop:6912 length:330 start_codon:yes stop_codon:yes gene_type:complete